MVNLKKYEFWRWKVQRVKGNVHQKDLVTDLREQRKGSVTRTTDYRHVRLKHGEKKDWVQINRARETDEKLSSMATPCNESLGKSKERKEDRKIMWRNSGQHFPKCKCKKKNAATLKITLAASSKVKCNCTNWLSKSSLSKRNELWTMDPPQNDQNTLESTEAGRRRKRVKPGRRD